MRVLLGVLAVLALPASPAAAAGTIQPGDPIDHGCTLAWVFDGPAGEVFFATASHCGGVGTRVEVAGELLGTVVYAADHSRPEGDAALIRVREELETRVTGELRGHPDMPTGVIAPTDAAENDTLQLSGWGMGWEYSAQTRESRVGVLLGGSPLHWEGVAPVTGGDSGGPVAHAASGAALGVVKGHSCDSDEERACRSWGASVGAVQQLAAGAGVPVTLRQAGAGPPAPAAPGQSPPSQAPGEQPPASPATPPEPASARVKLQAPALSARRLGRGRTLRVAVRTSRPLAQVRVALTRSGRTLAAGRRAQLASDGSVKLRVRRALRPGVHRVELSARDDAGRPVRGTLRVRVRR